MSAVPASPAVLVPTFYRELIERLPEALERARELTNQIIDAVNGVARWLPWFLADRVTAGLDRLREVAMDALAQLFEYTRGIAFPAFGLTYAGRLEADVRDRLNEQVGLLADDRRFPARDSWEGDAATRYGNDVVPEQTTALSEAASIAGEMGGHLRSLSFGVIDFYIGFLAAVIAAIAVLVGAVGTSATVVGAPVGISIGVGGWLTLTGVVANLVRTVVSLVSRESTAIAATNGRLLGATFPGGNWPVATS